MFCLRALFFLLLITELTACGMFPNHEDDYKTQDGSIRPINSVDSKFESYYPVSGKDTKEQLGPVDLIPPGSLVEEYQHEKEKHPPLSVTQQGDQLITNRSDAQAWEQVGKALQTSGYRVLQQDSNENVYDILDTVSTEGVVKRDTPIYRVQMQPSNSGGRIHVLTEQGTLAPSIISDRILGDLKARL